jgi:6-pyruvoyltetrahydropterin/6-carboxytetrahydropterin synthase
MIVTRVLEWDMGHRVPNHKSKCKNVHGHRYKAEIALTGNVIQEEDISDEGMVMDFSDIKTVAKQFIDDYLDHGFMAHSSDEELIQTLQNMGSKVVVVDFIPTAENIAKWMFDKLAPLYTDVFKTGLRLWKITLWETPNNFVELQVGKPITYHTIS